MAKTNSKLKSLMETKTPNTKVVEARNIPAPNTTNRQGQSAYSQDKWLKLLTMLNTLKLQNQYYRTEQQTLKELQGLIKECALEDLYLTCQCIVYSRCLGEGMRTISHAASVFIAPYISGQEYSKRFYGPWNRRENKGGVIFRPDDMEEIISGFVALNGDYKITTVTTSKGTTSSTEITGTKLTNAMKKGFRNAIESYDSHQLLKYKSSLVDVINLVHPRPSISGQYVLIDDKEVYTIDAIMKGLNVSADTWEANQSEAGQIVAKADNWKELLDNNKLGILAGIRNIRNILLNKPEHGTINKLCDLVSNATLIRQGKIFPYQIDLANETMLSEFNGPDARKISQALSRGYVDAVPNLAELLPGRNVVMLDQSGSMHMHIKLANGSSSTSCAEKAALIAATIAKATNADIICFGSTARYVQYNPNMDVFSLAKQLCASNMGGTSLSSAWQCAQASKNQYDRVFILSDNECNRGNTYSSYMSYVKAVGSPYVYSVDLAGYGTNCIAGDKVRYYYGYGFSMFEDIAKSEFNANYHLEKVKKVVI